LYIFASLNTADREGDKKSPFSLIKMDLKDEITAIVEEKLAETGSFLVEVKVTPTKIFVFIDNANGIRLEECIELSKYLQQRFDGSDVFEHHELEVSSPGIDEPFKVLKQYLKRIGQKISVLKKDGIRKDGILQAATEKEITIEEITKRKINGKRELTTNSVVIPLEEIKETKLLWGVKEIR
jgi:ribosome maturation factor RimP